MYLCPTGNALRVFKIVLVGVFRLVSLYVFILVSVPAPRELCAACVYISECACI